MQPPLALSLERVGIPERVGILGSECGETLVLVCWELIRQRLVCRFFVGACHKCEKEPEHMGVW